MREKNIRNKALFLRAFQVMRKESRLFQNGERKDGRYD